MEFIEGGTSTVPPVDYEEYLHKQFFERALWELKRSAWPKNCFETGEPINMFALAYKGTTYWNGEVVRIEWISMEQYLFMKLKGEL